jgi:FkbM family methyltransferase
MVVVDVKLLNQKDFTILNKRDIVVVDLGCACGDFTAQLNCFDNITIVGVDPLIDVYLDMIRQRKCSNNLVNYSKLIRACVVKPSDITTEVEFNYYPEIPDVSSVYQLNPNISSDSNDKDCFYHHTASVVTLLKNVSCIKIRAPTISLPDIIKDLDHVDILKIDIQGLDLDVLTDVSQCYFDKITMIHIEGLNPNHQQPLYQQSTQSYDDYISFFNSRGYQLVGLYKLDNSHDYTSDIDYIFSRI